MTLLQRGRWLSPGLREHDAALQREEPSRPGKGDGGWSRQRPRPERRRRGLTCAGPCPRTGAEGTDQATQTLFRQREVPLCPSGEGALGGNRHVWSVCDLPRARRLLQLLTRAPEPREKHCPHSVNGPTEVQGHPRVAEPGSSFRSD